MSEMRRLPFALLLITLSPACGGAKPPANSPQAADAQPAVPHGPAGKGTKDDPVQLCHMNGGPSRSDYPYIANYQCADSSKPLGGDSGAGAEARVGNVGPGPDGHIIDLYRVPCSGAPVEVYVDAYHCGPHVNAEAGVDIDHLSREELAGLAALIRHLHEDPVSEKASNRRKAAADFILATNQLHVELCGPLLQLLPQEERVPYYVGEFLLSMGAAVIEDGGEHPDPIEINMRTLDGVLVFYQAVLKQVGEGERQPSLDALLAKSKDRAAFQQFVTDTLNGCGGSNLGVEPGS